MTDVVPALDVGGTKIAAGLVDRDGAVLRSVRVPTPVNDAEATWGAVASAVDQVLRGEVVAGVGIACAGPVDSVAGTASPINVPVWQRFPLRDRVADVLPGVRVELAGDGVCMALGGHWRGAGRGSRFMVGLVVSTGVGGGLVLGGRAFGGRTGNAGHIGHVVVEPGGVDCTCGGWATWTRCSRRSAGRPWSCSRGHWRRR